MDKSANVLDYFGFDSILLVHLYPFHTGKKPTSTH